jgi:hypothetical protein
VTTCAPATCICCVCTLRRSDEFGSAFDAEDTCCDGCHDEMGGDGWPGDHCPAPVPPTHTTTTEDQP